MSFSTKSKKLLFHYWQPFQEADRFFLRSHSQSKDADELLVYTEKSINRELKNLFQKLDQNNNEKNSKFFWVAPFYEKIFFNLDHKRKHNFFWICCANFSKKKPLEFKRLQTESKCLIFDFETLRSILQNIEKEDTIKIELHPSLRNSNIFQELKKLTQNLIQQAALRLKTIQHFEKTWSYNFKVNFEKWKMCSSIFKIGSAKPDYFILGGPSVADFLSRFNDKKKIIWSADTSWMPLVHHGIIPKLVFSIDAGYGSFEHFIYYSSVIKKTKIKLVLDPLSFPKFYDIGAETYSYISSHPLVQQAIHDDNGELKAKFPVLSNETGDVYGIMQSFHFHLFGNTDPPQIIGYDQGPKGLETHVRGSGYHERKYNRSNRFATLENYFLEFSLRY